MHTRRWIFAICGLLVAMTAAWWLFLRAPRFGNRVYRIGWMVSVPFQVRGADGGPAGISVDLVNEAARRRGIALQWVYWNNSSESALVSKSVDLWPLITITPERLKVLHISEPYLQHEHCLLVRADSSYRKVEDVATARIGVANTSIDVPTLRKVLPSFTPAPQSSLEAVFDDLCQGTTDAAFMDRYTAISGLLQTGCDGHTLRWIPIPQLHSRLGVGSTFEAARAADAIRAEIGAMTDEGALGSIFSKWGYMSGQDVVSVESLVDARRREARLVAVALIFGLMFGLACWQTLRLIRERNRTRRTEEALRTSQERFMQAQKLESIGRLAGGVAHDFNNLLTVINGYSDLVFQQLGPADPMRVQIDEIRKAGSRAAELTQQLLAFGRKQVGRPRAISLSSLVEESQKMFQRLLGEDIHLVTRLDPALGLVMADPGHIHQVLMNLAVNARDAMPDGGTLVIETANEETVPRNPLPHAETPTRRVARLSFRDTGAGMDENTRKNIFEPFFTTKGPAKGTGLGLATVYGIVQQCRGWIDVDSHPGQGAAFHLFFPRVEDTAETIAAAPQSPLRKTGSETVLVVEDQSEVRAFAVKALSARGYRVLEAADGAQALALCDRHKGAINVLLTDVVLPGMNGRELADRFRAARPGIKIIYTSGYSEDLIAHRGVLHQGVAYLPKPYTADEIAVKVRDALEAS